MQRIDNKRKQKKMDYDIKWKNIQRILTRTKKSSKIKVQSKKEKKRGETQMAVERKSLSFLRAKKGEVR